MPRRRDQRGKITRPSQEAARDGGPRLIPLDEAQPSDSRLQHYTKLADIALAEVDKKEGSDDER